MKLFLKKTERLCEDYQRLCEYYARREAAGRGSGKLGLLSKDMGDLGLVLPYVLYFVTLLTCSNNDECAQMST